MHGPSSYEPGPVECKQAWRALHRHSGPMKYLQFGYESCLKINRGKLWSPPKMNIGYFEGHGKDPAMVNASRWAQAGLTSTEWALRAHSVLAVGWTQANPINSELALKKVKWFCGVTDLGMVNPSTPDKHWLDPSGPVTACSWVNASMPDKHWLDPSGPVSACSCVNPSTNLDRDVNDLTI